ncbi:MAG: hypothetical protein A3H96_10525 [Acidobacteria bacterium RIFCSPLOWO2_02_FULL_67_36]|nr:MAG: hypothetical protein A3H96_10525 [Acidobacteria bacterium RIFCSPLOWO2_02_FULL_67_36]OFW24388.1 MAG: hypothetical protein A3G21_17645 [Acidobacteria bacterium RIFCSPLOWO2_12_FULL_66_21]
MGNPDMKTHIRAIATIAALAATLALARAEAPRFYAIKGARLVTAAGADIPTGTLVIRNGLIEEVGADVQAPAGAVVIDGAGLTVYPGLVDMGTSAGLDVTVSQTPPANQRTTEEAERWKRSVIFRPDLEAADHIKADATELSRLASAGITAVLATPPGVVFKGRSALVNVAAPDDEPQIGNVGDYRQGLQIVRTRVALHIEFPGNVRGDGYPAALLGVISFVRQSFLDAQHQHAAGERYERVKTGATRPAYDPSLDALQPALEGKLPVAFEANAAREILRALDMAKEFKLDPVITGAGEADRVAADLKTRGARVIYSLNFPVRPRTLAPDADEPIAALRARASAPKVPAALQSAGIVFAFASSGLREPRDFLRNAARAVKEGLPREAALLALTADAARIAGAGDRVGTLEKGKIANIVVTDMDLFDERVKIKHVFVGGRPVRVEAAPAERRGR